MKVRTHVSRRLRAKYSADIQVFIYSIHYQKLDKSFNTLQVKPPSFVDVKNTRFDKRATYTDLTPDRTPDKKRPPSTITENILSPEHINSNIGTHIIRPRKKIIQIFTNPQLEHHSSSFGLGLLSSSAWYFHPASAPPWVGRCQMAC